jgi:hypothetical protein
MTTDRNKKIDNVEKQFDSISITGSKLNLKASGPNVNLAESHVQGVAIYMNYYIASHNDKGYSKGIYMILDGKNSYQLETYDEHFNHPGGIQIIGDYLIAAVENSDHDAAHIRLYDMSKMCLNTDPKIYPEIEKEFDLYTPSRGAGAVGITSYERENKEYFLLCTFDSAHLYFYHQEIPSGKTLPQIKFTHSPVVQKVPNYSQSSYTSLTLLTDISGIVYLIGLRVEGEESSYKDIADLYRLDTEKLSKGESNVAKLIRSRQLKTVHGSIIGIDGIHFRWGSGVKICSSHNLKLLATQRNFTGGELDINIFHKDSHPMTHVTVVTGNESGAGTDSNISMGFKGEKGTIEPVVVNGYIKGNAFENGQTDRFTLELKDIGTLQEIIIKSDGKYAGSDWLCDTVTVAYNGDAYRADVRDWFKDTTPKRFPLKNINTLPDDPLFPAHFVVVTGNEAGAGTDSNISMGLKGEKGTIEPTIVNGYIKGNAFEKGQTDQFTLELKDIGTLREISISSDGKYAGSDWLCDTITVAYKGTTYRAAVRTWFKDTNTLLFALKDIGTLPATAFFTVVTGNKSGAGTDSNISMGFKGEKGTIEPVVVNGYIKGNAFENGQTDQFTMELKDVGTLREISIRSDGKYAGSYWLCDTVTVTYKGIAYRADVYQWLNDTATHWFSLKKM